MIQIGDIVKLRASIFEKEFNDPNCEWSNKYIYEDKFEHVSVWFENMEQEGESACTIFGSTESVVTKIEYLDDGQPFIVMTTLFRIIFPSALENKEISTRPFDLKTYRPYKADKSLIEDLEFFEKEYKNGLFSILERENNKMDKYKLGFCLMKQEKKWMKQ